MKQISQLITKIYHKLQQIPKKLLIAGLIAASILSLVSFGLVLVKSLDNSKNSNLVSQKNTMVSDQRSSTKDYTMEKWKNPSPENITKLEKEQTQDLITSLTQIDLAKYSKPYLLVDGDIFDQDGRNIINTEIQNTKIFTDSHNYYYGSNQTIRYTTPQLFESMIIQNKFYQPMGISTIMTVDLTTGKVEWSDTGFEVEFVNSTNGRIYLAPKVANTNTCTLSTQSCLIFEFDPTTKKLKEIYNQEKLQKMGAGPCGTSRFQVEFVDENYIYLGYDCGERFISKYDKNGKFVEGYSLDFLDGYGWTIGKWTKDIKLIESERNKLWSEFYKKFDLSKETEEEGDKRTQFLKEQEARLVDKYKTITKKSDQTLDCQSDKNKYKCEICPNFNNYSKEGYSEKLQEIQKLKNEAKSLGQDFVCLDTSLKEILINEGQIEFQKLFNYSFWQGKNRLFNKNLFDQKDYPKGGVCGNFIWDWQSSEYNREYLSAKIFNAKLQSSKSGLEMENGEWTNYVKQVSCIE